MDNPNADAPPLPRERTAPPAVARAGCIVACGLALLPMLYVGSFAFLVADAEFGWGLTANIDEQTGTVLNVFYWPLIWLYVTLVVL